jgi:hypothetical protein
LCSCVRSTSGWLVEMVFSASTLKREHQLVQQE